MLCEEATLLVGVLRGLDAVRFDGIDVLRFGGGVTAISGTLAEDSIATAARFRGMVENRAMETRTAIRIKVNSIQRIQSQ